MPSLSKLAAVVTLPNPEPSCLIPMGPGIRPVECWDEPPPPTPSAPTLPDFVVPQEADLILNLLAWCSTAAGVAGLLIVGMHLALQLRRGEPGEGATYYRQGVIVVIASIIAATAGPIVEYLGPFTI